MNTTRSITTLFSLLLLLATGVWFFLTNASHIKLVTPTDISEHRFTAIEIQQFDKTGRRVYHLTAPSSYHMPKEDTHHLITPRIFVTKANQPAWTIQAKTAIITPKAEEIKFLTNVNLHHAAYQDQAPGVIKTEALSYFPKKKYAYTPLDITWDQGSNHVEATGMQADLTAEHIELLKNIRGTYRPNHG